MFTAETGSELSVVRECAGCLGVERTYLLSDLEETASGISELTVDRFPVTTRSRALVLCDEGKVRASVAVRDFRGLQVKRGKFPNPGERLTIRDDFGNYSPFLRGLRREWMWIQERRLRYSNAGPVTPRGNDSVTRHDATGEVW